jgi:chemotaxis protein methyltransferase CheR
MNPSARVNQTDPMSSFKFTDGDFRQIARILKSEAGIFLSDAKAPFVYSRLTKRLRVLGFESFQDYCSLVASDGGGEERRQMIAALTTNVTRFFREPHHFEHFKRHVVDRLTPSLRRGGQMRVWSSACSNGQEPYSIAMSIFSLLADADNLNVKVLATDIDSNMIAAAVAGEYSDDVVAAVPDDMRRKWFLSQNNGVSKVEPKLASIVAFRELNLIGNWPMKGKFDAIFCRNVAIYFEESTQQRIWSRFVPMLNPGGVLYIGHSERISGPASDHLVADGVTTYRLVKGSAA